MQAQALPCCQYTVHYRPEGFHGSLEAVSARHRFNPPPTANADVESSHATIEAEFFDPDNFVGRAQFDAAVTTYQHFFNFACKNRSCGNHTPADLLAHRVAHLSPKNPPPAPTILNLKVGQDLVWTSRARISAAWQARRSRPS